MNDHKLKRRLGAVIILACMITLALLIMFEAFPSLRTTGYEIMVQFPSAAIADALRCVLQYLE